MPAARPRPPAIPRSAAPSRPRPDRSHRRAGPRSAGPAPPRRPSQPARAAPDTARVPAQPPAAAPAAGQRKALQNRRKAGRKTREAPGSRDRLQTSDLLPGASSHTRQRHAAHTHRIIGAQVTPPVALSPWCCVKGGLETGELPPLAVRLDGVGVVVVGIGDADALAGDTDEGAAVVGGQFVPGVAASPRAYPLGVPS